MKPSLKKSSGGRPRSFDVDIALEKAMHVFWKKGYDSTSIADLTAAIGIKPPSLYAAFGNKESLFLKVLERYGEGPASYVTQALEAPTAREVAARRLYGAIDVMSDSSRPLGCLVVQALAKSGDATNPLNKILAKICSAYDNAFIARFKRAKKEGDLPKDANPAVLARYITILSQGISIQAASGASRSDLRLVVDLAMRQWPGGPGQ